jgi:hypothetical protein
MSLSPADELRAMLVTYRCHRCGDWIAVWPRHAPPPKNLLCRNASGYGCDGSPYPEKKRKRAALQREA